MSHHENKGHSVACCNLPPVEASYNEKGTYSEIHGYKTYSTGSSSAELGIIIVYDIFGFSAQGNQGADLLTNVDGSKQYKVWIPDFLKGNYAEHSWIPPDTEEKSKKLGALFGGPAAPPASGKALVSFAEQLAKDNPQIKKWATLGLCWGGKVITLALQSTDQFSVVASVHPAMVDAKDAEAIKVPYLMLPSKDEDAEAVKEFEKALKVEHKVETFGDQPHGWMGARGDLKDERGAAEYKRGYETVLHFFHQHL